MSFQPLHGILQSETAEPTRPLSRLLSIRDPRLLPPKDSLANSLPVLTDRTSTRRGDLAATAATAAKARSGKETLCLDMVFEAYPVSAPEENRRQSSVVPSATTKKPAKPRKEPLDEHPPDCAGRPRTDGCPA